MTELIHLSRTQKMDGIKSWSLPALDTCPGARGPNGTIVQVCQGCYAREGRYLFPEVHSTREANRQGWATPVWVEKMTARLRRLHQPFFRWFDSGDIYHPDLARRIRDVIAGTPEVKHWIPTRSYKVPRIKAVLDEIDELPNAVVRYSADELDTPLNTDHPASVVVRSPESVPPGATLCRAYQSTPARCNGCRACWDKAVPLIAYPAHGYAIQRVATSSPTLKSVA